MKPALIFSERYYSIKLTGQIFPTDKYRQIYKMLKQDELLDRFQLIEPELPENFKEILAVFHTERYLNDLLNLRLTDRILSSEIPLNTQILNFFLYTTYGTVVGLQEALKRHLAINLGGGYHHAFPDHAEGFCYLNDIAISILYNYRRGEFTRCAVVDLDLHQGNGTAFGLKPYSWCFTLSIHQLDNYPETKPPSNLDIGFLSGVKGEEYLEALENALRQVLKFEPEVVIYQAGVDIYEDDLLGGFKLTMEDIRQRDRMVFQTLLGKGIPVLVLLGGGYAMNSEDVAKMHYNTCREALEIFTNLFKS